MEEKASGLSPSNITRLKEVWEKEYQWEKNDKGIWLSTSDKERLFQAMRPLQKREVSSED